MFIRVKYNLDNVFFIGSAIKAAVKLGRHCIFSEAKQLLRERVLRDIKAYKMQVDTENEINVDDESRD